MNSNIKAVYHIKDLGDGKKSIWMKVGTAFVNKDGSINVLLDALPVDGRLHIREEKPKRVYRTDEKGDV
jgi:hypothetical protein